MSQNSDDQHNLVNIEDFPEVSFTLVGKGAYGKVYKGVNLVTKEEYALKVTDYSEDRNNGIPA